MKAVVTGAAGFIGSNISKRLIQKGISVVGVDSLTTYYSPDIKRTNLNDLSGSPLFRFIEADLNKADLDTILCDTNFIFHQAGQPGVRKSWGSEFVEYVDANVVATQRLLEHAKKLNTLKRFVYASSSSVYGNATHYPTSETDLPRPMSPYGVSKLSAEHLCTLYAENFGVPTVSLRYFTVYGPGQRPDMAFTRFVKAIVEESSIEIYGTGEQIRDFTFVDDVVDANIRAAQIDSPSGSVFNVAGGSNVSLNGAIETLEKLSGTALKREYIAKVAGDVSRTGGDTSAIESVLGWKPTISLEDGLMRHLAWGKQVFAAGANV